MASVKKANVPPTHPTVYAGLALAVVGLLLATYAYTGTRVYDIVFAIVALVGGLLALIGIMAAAWGRSIMAARATRTRRGLISKEAMKLDDDLPTIAAPKEKKRFAFSLPKRAAKEERAESPAAVFAFKRRAPEPERGPERAPEPEPPRAAEPAEPDAPLVVLAPQDTPAEPVRVTLRCPQCGETFSAEGVRPFDATCTKCGFTAAV